MYLFKPFFGFLYKGSFWGKTLKKQFLEIHVFHWAAMMCCKYKRNCKWCEGIQELFAQPDVLWLVAPVFLYHNIKFYQNTYIAFLNILSEHKQVQVSKYMYNNETSSEWGTDLSRRSSSFCGLVLWALSPILVPSSFPTRESTSPVGSSLRVRSIKDRSACRTKLEF